MGINGEWISSSFQVATQVVENAQGWVFVNVKGEVKDNEGYGTFNTDLIT